jgi:hypothetical protein
VRTCHRANFTGWLSRPYCGACNIHDIEIEMDLYMLLHLHVCESRLL